MMTITKLPKGTEDEIRNLVESGDFNSGTDVVVQAVHDYVTRRNKAEHLRAPLQVSIDQYERGEYREFTPELRQQLWESALQRCERGEEPSPDVCP